MLKRVTKKSSSFFLFIQYPPAKSGNHREDYAINRQSNSRSNSDSGKAACSNPLSLAS
jgi:hypothetical protein